MSLQLHQQIIWGIKGQMRSTVPHQVYAVITSVKLNTYQPSTWLGQPRCVLYTIIICVLYTCTSYELYLTSIDVHVYYAQDLNVVVYYIHVLAQNMAWTTWMCIRYTHHLCIMHICQLFEHSVGNLGCTMHKNQLSIITKYYSY